VVIEMRKEKKSRIDIATNDGRNRLVLHINDKYTTMTLLKMLGGSAFIIFFDGVAIFAAMDSRITGLVIFAAILVSLVTFFVSLTDVFSLYHVVHVDIDMMEGTMAITDDYGYKKSTRHYDPRDVDEVVVRRGYYKGHAYGSVSLKLDRGKSIVIARLGRLDYFDLNEIQGLLEPLFKNKTMENQRWHQRAHVEAFERTLFQYEVLRLTFLVFTAVYVAFTLLPLYEPIGTSPAGGVLAGFATFLGIAASVLAAISCAGDSTEKVRNAVSKPDLKRYVFKIRTISNQGFATVFVVMVFGFVAMFWYTGLGKVSTGAFREFLNGTFWTGCPLAVGPFSILTAILAILCWTSHNGRFKREMHWCE